MVHYTDRLLVTRTGQPTTGKHWITANIQSVTHTMVKNADNVNALRHLVSGR